MTWRFLRLDTDCLTHKTSSMAEHRHLQTPVPSTLAVEEAAQGFAAVGSEPRLTVLRMLVRAGTEGLTVGEIQARTALPASTLAHHLRFLAAGGLIEQERQGRAVISRAAYDRIEALAAFLLDECCTDARPSPQAHSARKALRSWPP